MNIPAFDPSIQQVIEQIRAALPPGSQGYLVGGAIRDALLGRPIHDLDFVLDRDAIRFGRRVAKIMGAAFFPLDSERDTGRLILNNPPFQRLVIDFAAMRGPDLESDLRDRDFSINAMALDIRQPDHLIDPLGGARDLFDRVLHTCSPASFIHDPMRLLRAVRLSVEYKVRIPPETIHQMRPALTMLSRVSPERSRDELFRILEGKAPASALRLMDYLGVLDEALPEFQDLKGIEQSPPHTEDVWNHSLSGLQKLQMVLDVLALEPEQNLSANLAMGIVSLKLGRYRLQLHNHLSERLNPERPIRSLIFLAMLYHDIAKPQTRQEEPDGKTTFYRHEQVGSEIVRMRAEKLHLSNSESDRLATIVRHHMRPFSLAQTGLPPTARSIYRFFRDTGPAGVDICLLSLADMLATYGPGLPQTEWNLQVDLIRILLEAWWERREEKISPPPLLNGNEILDHFQLKPGPQIGKLLEELREAEAAGEVQDRGEALNLIRSLLNQG